MPTHTRGQAVVPLSRGRHRQDGGRRTKSDFERGGWADESDRSTSGRTNEPALARTAARAPLVLRTPGRARAPRAYARSARCRPAVAASPTPPPDARAFASALSLLSVAYGRVSAARRWAYEVGLLTATSVPAPVVSVGNVTWGGSGKTPMAELVAREMAAAGATPAVLSRGYRGGDEAWMLRRRLADVRGARVLVGADRVKLALEALAGYGGGDDARRAPETHIEPSSPEHSHPATHSPVAFAREAKFAGDVDVDDVALRCVDPAKAAATTAAVERTSTTAAPLASSARPPIPRDPRRAAALVLDDGAQHLRLPRPRDHHGERDLALGLPPGARAFAAATSSAAPTPPRRTTPTSREPSTRRRPRCSARDRATRGGRQSAPNDEGERASESVRPRLRRSARRVVVRRADFVRRRCELSVDAWPVTSAPRLRTSGRRR